MFFLTIIIPAWQEAKRIGSSLETLSEFLAAQKLGETEVLVVVADSSDGTLEIAQSKSNLFKNFRVLEAGRRVGKGRDVRLAMQEAKGTYRLFMDADLATPLHHLKTVHQFMKKKADVIIGVRDLQNSHRGLRKVISVVGNLLIRWMLHIDIRDTQCGFKAFRGTVANDLFGVQTINGWGFDIELLAIAKKRGYSIQTISIHDWHHVEGGTLNNIAIRGSISTLRDLLKIMWNSYTGKYKQPSDQTTAYQES